MRSRNREWNGGRPGERRAGGSRWKRILLVVILVIGIVAAVLVASWRVLDAMGRSSLYSAQEHAAPTLGSQNGDGAAGEAGENGSAGSTADAQSAGSGEDWQEGWVRYQGKIYQYNSRILTFLFMGIDDMGKVTKKAGGQNGGQADGLFLLVINPDTKKISIVAINRNTMTEMDQYDADGNFEYSGKGQICLAHGFGDGMQLSCERQEKVVSNLFYNLPINGYVSINMGAVPTINDTVGGVTVPRMRYENGKIVYGDDETIHGKEALQYVRYRGEDFDAATYRLEKQKVYLRALCAKMLSQVKSSPGTAVSLFQEISPYMVTDISLSEVTYLADNLGGYSFDDDIHSLKGETTVGDQGFEEFHYDEDALYDLMIQVFYEEVKGQDSGSAK